jgi:1-acyl-sn-glycerol-3-phosphate acyltransferase
MRHGLAELIEPATGLPGGADDSVVATSIVRRAGRWAFQCLRMGAAGVGFVSFAVGAVVLTRIVLPLCALWPGDGFACRLRCQRAVRFAWIVLHDYLRITGLIRFNHRNCKLTLHRPSVIIANHPTLTDITALVCALGPVCFVAKRKLFENLFFGPLLRTCGHIRSVEGADSDEPGALEQALKRLAQGHSVLLFPEGTRSPPHGLGRFRMGAFELARRANVPLVVVEIGAHPLGLNKGVAWYAIPPVAMNLSLSHLLTFDEWKNVPDLHALTEVRNRIRTLLAERVVSVPPQKATKAEFDTQTVNLTQA